MLTTMKDSIRISSCGSIRARKHEKAQADEATQINLWIAQMRLLKAEHPWPKVMDLMRQEIQKLIKEKPQRKQQINLAWLKVENAYKHSK